MPAGEGRRSHGRSFGTSKSRPYVRPAITPHPLRRANSRLRYMIVSRHSYMPRRSCLDYALLVYFERRPMVSGVRVGLPTSVLLKGSPPSTRGANGLQKPSVWIYRVRTVEDNESGLLQRGNKVRLSHVGRPPPMPFDHKCVDLFK